MLMGVILRRNDFTNIPKEILNRRYLSYIDVAENRITGSLSGFGRSLQHVNISMNKLEKIETWSAPDLILLDASFNKISGSLPETIGDNIVGMPKLRLLDLSHNLLSGVIPSTMGSITNLQGLFLHNNNLVGTIPVSFTSKSVQLVQIFVEYNSLSGAIPAGLSNLPNLKDWDDSEKCASDIVQSTNCPVVPERFSDEDSDCSNIRTCTENRTTSRDSRSFIKSSAALKSQQTNNTKHSSNTIRGRKMNDLWLDIPDV